MIGTYYLEEKLLNKRCQESVPDNAGASQNINIFVFILERVMRMNGVSTFSILLLNRPKI